MKDETNNEQDFDRDDETMAQLLRLAGPRPPIPDEIETRVYERVLSEWETSTESPESARVYDNVHRAWSRRRAARRWALPVALAASVLVAIGFVFEPAPEPVRIAVGTVAKVVGNADAAPSIGQAIYAGDRLTTSGAQGLSVSLNQAGSLRLDENTLLVVEENNRFRLESGRVYADTGDFVYRQYDLVIDTSFGEVTDVGTQFAVAVVPDRLDVAVREGRVDIRNDATEFVAVAGEYLKIPRSGGADVEALSPQAAYWDWAQELAPAFDIENKPLLEFLRWAARESGRELVFENDELRMDAMRVDLHGSVADFDPLEAVESVLAGTRFRYRIEADRIVIEE